MSAGQTPSPAAFLTALTAAKATQAAGDFPRMRTPRETRVKLIAYLAMTKAWPNASRAAIADGLGISFEEAVHYLAPLRLDRPPRWLRREDLEACVAAVRPHATPPEAIHARPKSAEPRPLRRFEIELAAPRDLVRTRLVCVAPSRRAARLLAERFDGPRREEGGNA